jgi:predicted  nucleic acid-binding Zn-ribbon protein
LTEEDFENEISEMEEKILSLEDEVYWLTKERNDLRYDLDESNAQIEKLQKIVEVAAEETCHGSGEELCYVSYPKNRKRWCSHCLSVA